MTVQIRKKEKNKTGYRGKGAKSNMEQCTVGREIEECRKRATTIFIDEDYEEGDNEKKGRRKEARE
jgi:hypothetical protein